MRCPNCDSRSTGKIGNQHFFCSDCYVEFVLHDDFYEIFNVDDQGELIPLNLEAEGS